MRNAAIVVGILLVTVPAFGQPTSAAAQTAARFGALRAPQHKDAYRNLFQPARPLAAPVSQPTEDRRPKVVCGMLVIPADPTIDPKIAVPPNKAPGVEFKIRAMEPPVCKGE